MQGCQQRNYYQKTFQTQEKERKNITKDLSLQKSEQKIELTLHRHLPIKNLDKKKTIKGRKTVGGFKEEKMEHLQGQVKSKKLKA